jgi:5-methylcytosine-specific restriction protein A
MKGDIVMVFNPGLSKGQVINNSQLRAIFKVGMMGGMRRSLENNALVIVSDHTRGLYKDRWEGDILHYTGMGQEGDQGLIDQNKTLFELNQNNVAVFLLEVFKSGQYIYQGQIGLASAPYIEKQIDKNECSRSVWMFPVKLLSDEQPFPLSPEILNTVFETEQKKAKRLSDSELLKRIKSINPIPSFRDVISKQIERSGYVSEYAKRRAGGFCQLCEKKAPFCNQKGEPFLETHHITWLSRGGTDSIDNAVALCPNCHSKMHILDLDSDMQLLRRKIAE